MCYDQDYYKLDDGPFSYERVFIWAVENNHLPIVDYLLSLDIDCCDTVDEMINEQLCVAAEAGFLKIIKYLIEKGADVRYRNNRALYKACGAGHLEVVKYLIKQGLTISDIDIAEAVRNKQVLIVEYIIKCAANEKKDEVNDESN